MDKISFGFILEFLNSEKKHVVKFDDVEMEDMESIDEEDENDDEDE